MQKGNKRILIHKK